MRCQGIAKSTQEPCGNRAMHGFDYCKWHVKCCGRRNDGEPCGSRAIAELGYLYCRPSHVRDHDRRSSGASHQHGHSCRCGAGTSVPVTKGGVKLVGGKSKAVRMTDTQEFRVGSLLQDKTVAVWSYRDHEDAYSCLAKEQLGRKIEFDHVLEIHVVRDAFDKVSPNGNGFKRKKETLRKNLTSLLNDKTNLNFTTKAINQLKFHGVKNFQKGYCLDNAKLGLAHYLKKACVKEERLRRGETARIGKEIVKSYDHVTAGLHSEDALEGQVLDLLHRNLATMDVFDLRNN